MMAWAAAAGYWCMVYGNTRTRHGDRLRGWAADKGWKLTRDGERVLEMKRERDVTKRIEAQPVSQPERYTVQL